MAQGPEPSSRRQWLLSSLVTGILATLAVLLYPVVRFLKPREATVSGALEVVAGRLDALRRDGSILFNFGGKPCLVIETPDKELRAFSALCTHVDCTVAYRKTEGDIFCNCHNGVYDLHGRNVSGPPPRPLEEYKVTKRGNPGQEEIVVSRTA